MLAGIAVMVVAWAIVMLGRHAICARWWAYKLQTATAAEGQVYYLQRLIGLGEAAVSAGAMLLADVDADIRTLGVALLGAIPGEAAGERLLVGARDSDPRVRRLVIEQYAARPEPAVATRLTKLMDDNSPDVAMLATARFGLTRPMESLEVLRAAARGHRHVGVRVQAIQVLGINRAAEGIDDLIACLDDATGYTGCTATDESGVRASQAAAGAGTPLPPGGTERVYSIGAEAAAALRSITSQSFGYRADDSDARATAIAAWKTWRRGGAATSQGVDP